MEVENRRNIMMILCCDCGEPIEPNPTNKCVNCLRASVDITSKILKQGTVNQCKGCKRWLADNKNANSWIECGRESRELLAILLKKIKNSHGLEKNATIVDANFIWTEPHSKRLKVRIKIQQEIQAGAVIEQSMLIEFVEGGGMCNECHRMEAKDFWKCVVQVRQKRSHKKTFLYLEQLILKHNMHKACVRITGSGDGLDFFFADKQNKRRFLEFLQAVMPIKYSESQKLISHDVHTQTYNYKYTCLVTLPQVSKDDIICLPKILSTKNSNIAPLVICQRVTTSIHLIDFQTLDHVEIQKEAYWRTPFAPVADKMPLKEFMIMDIQHVSPNDLPKTFGSKSRKHELADVWLVPTEKFGTVDESTWIHTRTHLGKLFNCGDLCLGFDVQNSNVSESHFDTYMTKLGSDSLPDVIIVKKAYGNNLKRHKRREWKVKKLDIDEGGEDSDDENNNQKYGRKAQNQHHAKNIDLNNEEDLLEFYNEIEEDAELRQKVAIYKDEEKIRRNKQRMENGGFETENDDEETLPDDVPEIGLEEMLEDLELNIAGQEDNNCSREIGNDGDSMDM